MTQNRRKIVVEDCRRHAATSPSIGRWQESFYVGWVDLKTLSCGANHISLPKDDSGDCHVWSWTMLAGKVIARSQLHGIALPTGDFDNLDLGPLHIRSSEDPRQLDLTVRYNNGIVLDLQLQGNCDPVELSLDRGDVVLGDRHYEIMGMVTGTLQTGRQTIPILASSWSDHSWGRRDFSTNISHRWLWASFGADFAISVFGFVSNQGYFPFGWVWDAGQVHIVEHVEFHAIVADDGITPEGCDAVIRVAGNRTYAVRGRCEAAALMGGVGWHAMNGLTRFECGGRIGEGFLEINELKVLTAAMKTELSL